MFPYLQYRTVKGGCHDATLYKTAPYGNLQQNTGGSSMTRICFALVLSLTLALGCNSDEERRITKEVSANQLSADEQESLRALLVEDYKIVFSEHKPLLFYSVTYYTLPDNPTVKLSPPLETLSVEAYGIGSTEEVEILRDIVARKGVSWTDDSGRHTLEITRFSVRVEEGMNESFGSYMQRVVVIPQLIAIGK